MKTVKYINDKENGLCLYSIIDSIVDRYMTKYKIDLSRVSREDIVQDNVVIYLETMNKTYAVRYMRFKKYYKELSEQLDIPPEVNIDDIDIPVNNLYSAIMLNDCRDKIDQILKTIPSKNEKFIRKHYGIGSETRHTIDEVGRQLNISKSHAHCLKINSLHKLRHPSRTKYVKDYLEFFNE